MEVSVLTKKILFTLILGLLLFSAGLSFAEAARPTGPDEGKMVSSEKAPEPKMVSVDTNKDGKPDRWEYHDGNKVRVEADTNFDGKVDEIAYFEDGKLVKGEKDSDYDGKMDKWINY